MRVVVCGSSGCIGSAVVRALRWRGHRVVETRRDTPPAGVNAIAVEFARPSSVDDWAMQLAALDIDAIVNCAGTALPGPASALADRLHGEGPMALFRGAERAQVARIVNVSALGVDAGDRAGRPDRLGVANDMRRAGKRGRSDDGWRAKHQADDTLLRLDVDAVVVRPSLVHGPGSRSAEAMAALARARIQVLPDGGEALLQPIHVFELAESIASLVERTGAARGVYEVGGADVVRYRDLLAALRIAQGETAPLSLSVPLPVVRLLARLQRAPSPGLVDDDVLRLLDHVGTTHCNAAPVLLGRAPSTLAEGLLVTPPARSVFSKSRHAPHAGWLHHSRGVL